MRLISKIHDYYDTPFRASAGDPKYTFVRESKEYPIKLGKWSDDGLEFIEFNCTFGRFVSDFRSGIIGFCGKIYPYFEKHTLTDRGGVTEYYYTWDDFSKDHPEIVGGKSRFYKHIGITTLSWNHISKLDEIKNWLEKGQVKRWNRDFVATTYTPLLDVFTEKRVAYFIVEYAKKPQIVTYPTLKKYQFYKIFDTYTAFQKIEMFLTNDLSKPDDPYIMPIPDKIKATSHGFDKWSFRKMKGD